VVDVALPFALLAPIAFLVRSLVGVRPVTWFEIRVVTLTSFSIPVWLYVALCDASWTGATVGTRVLGVAVRSSARSGRVTLPRAVIRTAVKLAPWELAHVVGFALVGVVGPTVQTVGLVVANLLAIAWFGSAVATGGWRSVHDLAAGTDVTEQRAGASGGNVS